MSTALDEAAPATLEGWLSRLVGEVGPGGFPLNSTSVALEASRTVKSGAGTLFGLSGFNAKVAAQFVLVFDLESVAKLSAASIPVIVITAPTVANFSYDAGFYGRAFRAGIVIANSSTSTALTAGSADCWFDAQYA